ncbi:MAG: hypothetical protein ABEI75_02375 [Halobaculum sp.]
MTLSIDRRRAYTFGALTGASSTLAVVAARRGRRGRAALAAVTAVACGALAVVFEERAQA